VKLSSITERLTIKLGDLRGWHLDIEEPLPERCVVIGAPHTSNHDFYVLLLYVFGTSTRLHWVGKHTLFAGPLGPLMRALGGIPVNRSTTTGFVDQMIGDFRRKRVFRLAIAPEGTRKRSSQWKTGFYRIAVGAKVPLVLGYVDYPRKTAGYRQIFMPTGDLQADFQIIKDFYTGIQGKHPENQGPIDLPVP
jgi:1-acyl-sn-glycerol-3-phosphate acyltransferase